jgi:hypothetical protein
MRVRTIVMLTVTTLILFAVSGAGQTPSSPGFDQLKTLVGDWEGRGENGKTYRASYKLVSGGHALLEVLTPPEESEMMTVYHQDSNRVAMTHYCAANNQPHMRTAALTGRPKELDFVSVGVSNLASPTAGHMHALVVILDDKDQFTQKWTWRENGKDRVEVFHFTRKKS